jgi:hypothetical protein
MISDHENFLPSLSPHQSEMAHELRQAIENDTLESEEGFELIGQFIWLIISTEHMENKSSILQDPVVQFLAGASLFPDGSFKRTCDITSIIASLQYCLRLFFYLHCLPKDDSSAVTLLEFVFAFFTISMYSFLITGV